MLANRDPAASTIVFLRAARRTSSWHCSRRSGSSVEAPVELVTAPDDGYFPLGEAEQLAAALPTSRLTVTSALEHVRLRTTPRGVRDLLGLGGAAIRSLRAAAVSGGPSRRGRRDVGQPVRFLAVGACGYGLNVLAFAALYAADVSYAAGAVVAYLLSNALMYLGNRYFTFRLGRDGLLHGYVRYVVVGLLVVVLNVLLLAGLVEGAGLDPRLGQAFSLLASDAGRLRRKQAMDVPARPRLTPPRSAPPPTIAALVTTLVVVVACVVVEVSGDTGDPRRSSFVLALRSPRSSPFRVGGQLAVLAAHPRWLPPWSRGTYSVPDPSPLRWSSGTFSRIRSFSLSSSPSSRSWAQ